MLRERALAQLAEEPGSWQAGTHARTGLAACLGSFSLTAQQGTFHAAPAVSAQQRDMAKDVPDMPASNAETVLAQQHESRSAVSDSAAEVHLERQWLLNSLHQQSESTGDGDSSSRDELMQQGNTASQHASLAGEQAELINREERHAAVLNSQNRHYLSVAAEFSMLPESSGLAGQSMTAEQQAACMQLDEGQGQEQAGEGSMQLGAADQSLASGEQAAAVQSDSGQGQERVGEGRMQPGAPDRSMASERQAAAVQSGSGQGEEPAQASGSGQKPHQECMICFNHMQFAYVSVSPSWTVMRSYFLR